MGVESLLLFRHGRPVPKLGTLVAVLIAAALLTCVAVLAAIAGQPESHLMAPMRWWPGTESIG